MHSLYLTRCVCFRVFWCRAVTIKSLAPFEWTLVKSHLCKCLCLYCVTVYVCHKCASVLCVLCVLVCSGGADKITRSFELISGKLSVLSFFVCVCMCFVLCVSVCDKCAWVKVQVGVNGESVCCVSVCMCFVLCVIVCDKCAWVKVQVGVYGESVCCVRVLK